MGKPLELTPSSDLMGGGTPSWSHCTWRLLAEGDSWFSIGALNPLTSANLLQSMEFSLFTAAAHCSYPGDTRADRAGDGGQSALSVEPSETERQAAQRVGQLSGLPDRDAVLDRKRPRVVAERAQADDQGIRRVAGLARGL